MSQLKEKRMLINRYEDIYACVTPADFVGFFIIILFRVGKDRQSF